MKQTRDQLPGQAFQDQYQAYLQRVERALPGSLGQADEAEVSPLYEAARYSLMAGGKRIRPVLLLATADLLGVDQEEALPFALSLELIHTYSLIHDDLPAMDDDDLRRGRPTAHKAYGEAMAILAGDFLLNRAFELLLAALDSGKPQHLAAARLIGRASGGWGMIGGQVMDLAFEAQAVQVDQLIRMHRKKTGALLAAAVGAAVLLAGVKGTDAQALSAYARAIGLAFQIRDDLLDVEADARQLGKTPAKDQRDGKTTFVTLLGLDKSKARLLDEDRQARLALTSLGDHFDCSFLIGLTDFLLQRTF